MWARRYFREAIEFDGRFEFADGKAAIRWEWRQGDPEMETELERVFDPEWLRNDLLGSTLSASGGPPGGVVVHASGANHVHARSLRFAADGTIAEAVVSIKCGDGIEREGARAFTHEMQGDRRLLVKRRIEFAEADCAEETTFLWADHGGLRVPVEVRRLITRGKHFDELTFRLSGWKLEVEPRK